jgi:DNA-directed RNA polymerase subunit RPC12/RpoP
MKIACFHCGKSLFISAEQLGGEVACPNCGQKIRLPEAEPHEEQKPTTMRVPGAWLVDSASGVVSLLVHLILLLILAHVTCSYGGGGDMGEEVAIGELPGETLTESSDQFDVQQAVEQASQADQLEDTLEVETPSPTLAASDSTSLNISELMPGAAAGGGGVEVGLAGLGGGGALGEGASFMGVFSKGSRFCIIADNSGSMSGAKLEHVKAEILETITTIKGRGRFQVIFFNTRAVPFPGAGWRHPQNDRSDLANWLQSVTPGGGTNPLPAFQVALSMNPRPDVIFFMTDGQFEADVAPQVALLNGRGSERVVINTISFVDRSGEPDMQKIASDSGGKYRFVSGF